MRSCPRNSPLMWQLQLPDYSTAGQDVPLPISAIYRGTERPAPNSGEFVLATDSGCWVCEGGRPCVLVREILS